MELPSVEFLVVFEHLKDGKQEFPQGGDQALHFGLAARQEMLVIAVPCSSAWRTQCSFDLGGVKMLRKVSRLHTGVLDELT